MYVIRFNPVSSAAVDGTSPRKKCTEPEHHSPDRRTGYRLLVSVVLCSCVTLACFGSPGPGPGDPASSGPPLAGLLPGLREDLARIVTRESVERGDTLLHMLRERGFAPEIHEFPNTATDREPRETGRNLIVTVGEGSRDIVVGAHYDVVRLRSGEVVGGAVDNGAAAVVVTRVAETLGRHRLDHRVRIALFDLEEVGLLGSRAFVQGEESSRIAAMVNVDVVADDGILIYGPTAHNGNDVVHRSLRIACAKAAITCMGFPQYPPSDDRTFQAAGIPNVSLGMVEAITSHQLWLVLNAGTESGLRPGFLPNLLEVMHTAQDTIERVDPAAMIRVHDAIVALVLELDTALRGPG